MYVKGVYYWFLEFVKQRLSVILEFLLQNIILLKRTEKLDNKNVQILIFLGRLKIFVLWRRAA